MKLAFTSVEYPPESALGGMGTLTHLTARAFCELGHEVYVLSRGDHRHEYIDGGVHVIRIAGAEDKLSGGGDLADQVAYSVELAAEIERLDAAVGLDVVTFPDFGAEGYVYLLDGVEWRSPAVVLHLHGPLAFFAHTIDWPSVGSEPYLSGAAMEGACIRLADSVTASSSCIARWTEKYYGVEDASIPVFFPGVDTTRFVPLDVPQSDRPTVAFVGNVVENKGVDVLLDAVCELTDEIPGIRLRVYGRGEGEPLQKLMSRADGHRDDGVLEMCGFVDHDRLPMELCTAHVFAAPSTFEPGLGCSLVEAMACGVPVVATAEGGYLETVKDGHTGLLVPPGDRDALAAALKRLLTEKNESARLGRRGREWVVGNVDARRVTQRLARHYADVISRRKEST